jgi:predicted metal-dependent phosphoesterase TrpH
MPPRQPFTLLCQLAARGAHAGRADLHLHTTHSDGAYSPAEIIELAKRSGLGAVAVTDHDTLAGVPVARRVAGSSLEVVSGVEITSEYQGQELHLLAYFVALDYAPLNAALSQICRHRIERFQEMVERLRRSGVSIQEEASPRGAGPESVGRRHLAELLVRSGRVSSVREAFSRYLGDKGDVVVPKQRLPVAEALGLVAGAGGVAAWAHPPYDCDRVRLMELRSWGLRAVEVEYPDTRPSRTRELRAWAQELGLGVTGGSDCHGPGRRPLGARTVSLEELEQLRLLA